jgi:cell division septation protein DedD
MTDTRVDDPALEEDRLPWLEAVEEDDEREGPGAAKLIAFVVIGLVAIGLIVGGLFWMGNRETAPEGGEPEVIAAPDGDYKVKPSDPGGMKVEGEGDTAFAASAGADPKGALNVDAVPETPVARQKAAQTAQNTATPPAAAPKAAPAAPKAAEPAPKAEAPAPAPAAGGGAAVQLGAFSSQASANNAWKKMSGRFTYLAPLTHSVTTVTTGGKTLYRLRASGPDAASLCSRLRVAGESCVVVN